MPQFRLNTWTTCQFSEQSCALKDCMRMMWLPKIACKIILDVFIKGEEQLLKIDVAYSDKRSQK